MHQHDRAGVVAIRGYALIEAVVVAILNGCRVHRCDKRRDGEVVRHDSLRRTAMYDAAIDSLRGNRAGSKAKENDERENTAEEGHECLHGVVWIFGDPKNKRLGPPAQCQPALDTAYATHARGAGGEIESREADERNGEGSERKLDSADVGVGTGFSRSCPAKAGPHTVGTHAVPLPEEVDAGEDQIAPHAAITTGGGKSEREGGIENASD